MKCNGVHMFAILLAGIVGASFIAAAEAQSSNPTFTAEVLTDISINVRFSEPVSGPTAITQWSVTDSGVVDLFPHELDETDILLLELNTPLRPDTPITVTYTAPDEDPITDGDGNPLESAAIPLTGDIMTMPETPTPTMLTFSAEATAPFTITVTFSEPLTGVTKIDQWTITDGAIIGLVPEELDGEVELILLANSPLTSSTPRVTYTPPDEDPISDADGNMLESTDIQATDGIAPMLIAEVTTTTTITVSFSEPVFGQTHMDDWTVSTSTITSVSQSTFDGETLIVLEFTPPLEPARTPAVGYFPVGGRQLLDQSGHMLTGSVIATVITPLFRAETATPTTITVSFLADVTGTTAAADWDVDGTAPSSVWPTDLAPRTRMLTLTVGAELAGDATPTVTYTAAGSEQITSTAATPVDLADGTQETAADGIAPVLSNPTFTDAMTITIEVSEDIVDPSSHTFAIDPPLGTLAAAYSADDDLITLTTTAGAADRTTYTITHPDIVDRAADIDSGPTPVPNPNTLAGGDLDPVVFDLTPPTFTAQTATTTTITVTFSEPVTGTTAAGDWGVAGNTVSTASFTDDTSLTLVVGTALGTGAAPDVTYAPQDGRQITDMAPNPNPLATATIPATDGIAPTFTARTTTPTSITVTFSENLTGRSGFGSWAVSGNTVDGASTTGGTDTITLRLGTALQTDATPDVTYTQPPANPVIDQANNPVATGTVTPTDGIAPVLSNPTIVDFTTFTVDVSEEISASFLAFTTSPDLGAISASYDNTNDIITLVPATPATDLVTYTITHPDITDTAGNTLAGAALPPMTFEVPGPTFVANTSTTTSIRVLFSNTDGNLAGISGTFDASDWTVSGNTVTGANNPNPSNTNPLILNLATPMPTDATPDVSYAPPQTGPLTNAAGDNVLDMQTIETSDGVRPAFTAQTATPTSITVTFSEAVNVSSNLVTGWTIADGHDITGASPASLSGETEFILELDPPMETGATPEVAYFRQHPQFRDIAGNGLANGTVTAADGTAPSLSMDLFPDTNTILVRASEAIQDPGQAGFVPSPSLGPITGYSYDAAQNLITITTQNMQQPNTDYSLAHPAITDMASNVLPAGMLGLGIPVSELSITGIERIAEGSGYLTITFSDAIVLADQNVPATVRISPAPASGPDSVPVFEGTWGSVQGTTMSIDTGTDTFATGAELRVSVGGVIDDPAGNLVMSPNVLPLRVAADSTIMDTMVIIPPNAPDLNIASPPEEQSVTVGLPGAIPVAGTTPAAIAPSAVSITVEDVRVNIPAMITAVSTTATAVADFVVEHVPETVREAAEYTAAAGDNEGDNERIVRLLAREPLALVQVGSSATGIELYAAGGSTRALVDITLPEASGATHVYYIDAADTVDIIAECATGDAANPPTDLPTDDSAECYLESDSDIVIWTNHFTVFGASIAPGGTSGGDGCDDCTPPTLGVDNTGVRRVAGGFSYNGDVTDVEHYYTPLPLITVNVGEQNTATLKIFEDSGAERVRHAGLAFGLSSGQHFAESEAEIRVDIPFSGKPEITLDDPQNAIDADSLRAESAIGECMPGSAAECLVITIHHTFRAPLDFNVVSTMVWDERRNSWQNFFNHGIEVTGESLNPSHGIPVNGGALVLYPLIAGHADDDGDGIYDYDHRHVTYMMDDDAVVYRLTIDGTYAPIRNLSTQLHDIDVSMYDRDTAKNGPGRESALFAQMVRNEAEIAHQMLIEMDMAPVSGPDAGFVPSLYEDADTMPRMERLRDAIAFEIEAAEEISRLLVPQLYADES